MSILAGAWLAQSACAQAPLPPVPAMPGALRAGEANRADEAFECLVKPFMVVKVGSPVDGVLEQVMVNRGDRVGKGQVVAIDYLDMEALPGVHALKLDFTEEGAEDTLKSLLRDGHADVVLSDMAAPTTGHTSTDHLRIMGLAEAAGAFACDVLRPGGAFLAKVFQKLTRHNLVRSHRGAIRGYALARPAETIRLREILEAIEGPDLFERCIFWSGRCGDQNPCRLHQRWAKIRPQLEAVMEETTLAQVV